jgi:hypothetical protein
VGGLLLLLRSGAMSRLEHVQVVVVVFDVEQFGHVADPSCLAVL